MSVDNKINKYQISLDNREINPPDRNEAAEKKRGIVFSGLISLFLIIVIWVTLPLTVLSMSGLVVYSSIVALVIFLFFTH